MFTPRDTHASSAKALSSSSFGREGIALPEKPGFWSLGLKTLALWGLVVPATLAFTACKAQSVHDKVFFSCSAQAPACPENQRCNLEDNCCHLESEPPGSALGHCRLSPDGTGGMSLPGTSSK